MTNGTTADLDHQRQTSTKPHSAYRFLPFLGTIVVSGAFIAAAAGGIALLHTRAAAELQPQPAAPTVVATTTISIVPGYERTTSYVGRLEPARETALAFERSGLVTDIVPDEGDAVRAGDVIARMDTAGLASRRRQLVAQRRAFEAQRTLAKATLQRQSKLKTSGWSPDQRLDEAESNFATLTANIEATSAQIAGIDIDIAKSVLKAPFSGTIAHRSVDEGAVVASGAPVVDLLESTEPRARIGLPPDVAATLGTDRSYALRIGDRQRTARLIARRPDLEKGTRTVTALFELSAAGNQLPFGELVTIELNATVNERGAWVPLAALKEGRRGLWTILSTTTEDDAQVVAPEAVELLYATADRAFVRGTFKDGTRIISRGTSRIVPGQRIALAKE